MSSEEKLRAENLLLKAQLETRGKELKRAHEALGRSLLGHDDSPRKKRLRTEADAMSFIVVTGGVMSGLGKGITASSMGRLLRECGLRVTAIKIDPYLNCDAGTMSPFEHGECYVLDDGGETDLDLGNYERFIDINLTRKHSITTGNIYKHVLDKERQGKYLGKTVQVVPHITDHILERIIEASVIPVDSTGTCPDVCIIELGGTVGDIESMIFFEALRQLKQQVKDNMALVHVSLVACVGEEQKTKPTQHSVKVLSTYGLAVDFVACRCDVPVSAATKKKISRCCSVRTDRVLSLHNATDIWRVPGIMHEQNFCTLMGNKLGLYIPHGKPDLRQWNTMVAKLDTSKLEVKIAIVAKYTGMNDTYLSIMRSLQHSAAKAERKLKIIWVNAEKLENDPSAVKSLELADGILVPGGFGNRGIIGKVNAIEFARLNKIPFLGICLGMQLMVVEAARNVLNLADAHSEEMAPKSTNKVIIFMPEGSKTHLGGTMRCGLKTTVFNDPKCISSKLYGGNSADERHRHRYEVNPEYIERLEKAGLRFVGKDSTGTRMEVAELADHPYFVGCQFHPEYRSRPGRPAPLCLGLVLAASGQLKKTVS